MMFFKKMKNGVVCLCFSLMVADPLMAEEINLQESYDEAMAEPEAFIFVPPTGWLAADPKMLPPSVKAMVVGESKKGYPPSINIGMEPFEGSLKSYLKNIKLINESQNAVWKDLGQISTESGQASLSSVDMPTEWGEVRLLHSIMIKYGTAYIMTCASLKDEFGEFHKSFFQAMRSMKINKDVYEMVGHPEMRAKLMNVVQQFKKERNKDWEAFQKENPEMVKSDYFNSDEFQKSWIAFSESLDQNFSKLGNKWKESMILKIKKELGVTFE